MTTENDELNLFQDEEDYMFCDELDGEEEMAVSDAMTDSNPPWKIMIVDDEEDVHRMTERVLEDITFDGRGFVYLNAYSGKEAKELIEKHPDTSLILLDVVMRTENDGLKVVEFIRNHLKNTFVRIILRTGQPGQAPERKVITDYDIHDYKLKSMLTDQALYTAVISALRTYRDLRIIEEKHNELEQAMAEAQVAQKARYQILANMGHEIKTPLQGILGFTEILLVSETSDTKREYLNHIKDASEGLHKVLTNVLDLTELVDSTWDLNETEFNFNHFYEKILDTIQIQAEWKGLDLISKNIGNVPEVMITDRRRLKQVLMNLMINAVQHTEKGTVSVTVQLKPDNMLHFEISDTGAGISKEHRSQIFEPFMLGEDFLTKKYAGTGVGLSICKSILDKMNGKIWYESEPNQGTIFYFCIPIQTSA